MKHVYLRGWVGKQGSFFISLHATQKTARRFAKENPKRWKSSPMKDFYNTLVPNAQYARLVKKLDGADGIRLNLDELK